MKKLFKIIDGKGNKFFGYLTNRSEDGMLRFQLIEGKGTLSFYENDWRISIYR